MKQDRLNLSFILLNKLNILLKNILIKKTFQSSIVMHQVYKIERLKFLQIV